MKRLSILAGMLAMPLALFAQQRVSDGTANAAIDPNAVLEAQSSNKGLLLPRIALTQTSAAAPLSAHVAGMTVYNTATAGSGATAVTPGYYYNDGTQWVRVLGGNDSSKPWLLDGNTNGALRTLGTKDNNDLPFITNNTEQMRLAANGNLGVGTVAPDAKLQVVGGETKVGVNGGTQSRVGAGYIDFYNTSGVLKANVAANNAAGDLGINTFATSGNTIINPYAGGVGVGTVTPAGRLHSSASSGGQWAMVATSEGHNNHSGFYNDGSHNMHMSVRDANGNLGANLQSAGPSFVANSFGVGTAAPDAKLQVVGGEAKVGVSGGTESHIGYGYIDFYNTSGVLKANIAANNPNGDLGINTFGSSGNTYINPNAGGVSIGPAAPVARLDVQGNVRIADGTQGAGKVFTSDGNGVGSWQSAAANVILGVFGTGNVPFNNNNVPKYMNAYIDLPAGKWVLNAGFTFRVNTVIPPANDDWQHVYLSSAATSVQYSNFTILNPAGNGSTLAGNCLANTRFGFINGTMVVQVHSGVQRIHFLMEDVFSDGLNSSWMFPVAAQENYVYAIAVR